MKKILILTASTGEGHNQAARSLQEKYEEKGYVTYKLDFIREASLIMNCLISDGYKVMAQNMPKVYGLLYETADRAGFNRISRVGYSLIKRRLVRRILEIDPHVIVATHPFGVGLVHEIKRTHPTDFKFISVVTDFKAHYSYISDSVDAYITGSEYTKQTLVARSIPESRIYSYGIPVMRAFQEHSEPKYMRPGRHGDFRVLVMGGSMGSKDILKVVQRLIADYEGFHLEVVCGRNKALYEALKAGFSDYETGGALRIHGFTKDIPDLMDEADVIVTKPGGLTTSESLSKKLPMVIPFAIPGQEQENTQFLVSAGVAVQVEDVNDLPEQISFLKNNPRIYNRMVASMKRISDTYSVDKIIDLSESLVRSSAPIKTDWGMRWEVVQ